MELYTEHSLWIAYARLPSESASRRASEAYVTSNWLISPCLLPYAVNKVAPVGFCSKGVFGSQLQLGSDVDAPLPRVRSLYLTLSYI